jgi:hypothetical protein
MRRRSSSPLIAPAIPLVLVAAVTTTGCYQEAFLSGSELPRLDGWRIGAPSRYVKATADGKPREVRFDQEAELSLVPGGRGEHFASVRVRDGRFHGRTVDDRVVDEDVYDDDVARVRVLDQGKTAAAVLLSTLAAGGTVIGIVYGATSWLRGGIGWFCPSNNVCGN